MRTPKIHSLIKLIKWYELLMNIHIDDSNINSNAWLSGFIDADGHFSIRATKDKMECKFELSQRQKDHNDHDNYSFLSLIASFLNSEVKKVRMNTPNPQYRIRTLNLNNNILLISYLEAFPLFSSKYLDYKNWELVVNLFKEARLKDGKKLKVKENLDYVQSIKNLNNNNRKEFNWDHLNKFYIIP